MKKFFLMLAVALPMFFMASCGDDNDEETILTLDQTSLTLDYGKSAKLTASEKKGEWASSNEFVATVDKDGNVTAKHEGKATITYSKDYESASCTVTVNATNNKFVTVQTWGVSSATIKAGVDKSWKLIAEDDGDLMYSVNANEDFPWYGYIFEADKLVGSSIYFTEKMFDDDNFNEYLDQRYTRVSADNAIPRIYVDNFNKTSATNACVVDYDTDDEVYIATYMPVSHVDDFTRGEGNVPTVAATAKALLKKAMNK